ncbi:hypothetical protein Tco_1219788 [Tanacetum coccineum]
MEERPILWIKLCKDVLKGSGHKAWVNPSRSICRSVPEIRSNFWRSLQKAFGTNLDMSTAYHPQTTATARDHSNSRGYVACLAIALERVCWRSADTRSSKLIQETTEKIIQIKQRMQAARDRQKSYADLKRKPMEFQVGDKSCLRSSPWKGLELPEALSKSSMLTFHVSNLKKCHADEPLAVPLDGLNLDDKLHFVEEPVEIVGREVKRLKEKVGSHLSKFDGTPREILIHVGT